jgi:Na+/H+ antiporter NhaD/arsenite permease-like protein
MELFLLVILSSRMKFRRDRKLIIGFLLMITVAICILIIPELAGFKIGLAVKLSAIVLMFVYIALSLELVHRTTIALFGALVALGIAVSTGLFTASESFEFSIKVIDFNTIGLLLGMMIIVAILSETGIFQYVSIKASKMCKGNLWILMIILCTFTAVTSMSIDNVTTILLMIPVTISIFKTIKVSPIPFVLAMILSSNVGGASTLIGDPPNIMIGSAANIDFNSFILHMGPTIAISFVVSMALFRFLFRKDLKSTVHNLEQLLKEDERLLLKDKNLLKKSMIVLIGVVVLFIVHGSINLEPSVIALGGAAVLLLVSKVKPGKVLNEVDWPTLFFFTGLFIIIGVAEEAGMIKLLSDAAIGITGGEPWSTFMIIIWLSAFASAFVDNIPFTATMIPLIHMLNANPVIATYFSGLPISPLWWALSLGANLGGNGTLIGSSAGIIAAGLSEKHGYLLTFNQFLKVGFIFMILTVGIGTLVLTLDILFRL